MESYRPVRIIEPKLHFMITSRVILALRGEVAPRTFILWDMFRPTFFCGLSGLALAAAVALACEDDHPPVVRTPVETINLRSSGGENVLSLTFDPRGVGAIAPVGEDRARWIDADDKTGAWHYREWQWWKGHPWGDSCRPRYYSQVEFHARPNNSDAAIINYRIDGFDCRQVFLVPSIAETGAPHWDIVTTIRNVTGNDVEEYAQFFACYTPLNRKRSFWFWDESDKLVLFAERGVTHLDGYIANPDAYFQKQGSIPHARRGRGRIVGRWRHPVVLSQTSPAGWRSIIMLEPQVTASLAQGIEERDGLHSFSESPPAQLRKWQCLLHTHSPCDVEVA